MGGAVDQGVSLFNLLELWQAAERQRHGGA